MGKRKIIVCFVACFMSLARMKAATDFESCLDEVRDWRSLEEVVSVTMDLFDRLPLERTERAEEAQAFSFALRSAERVLDAQKREQKKNPDLVVGMEAALVSRRSIREIALLGVMMALSETVNVAPDGDKNLLESHFKLREEAQDVLDRRNQAIDALRLIASKGRITLQKPAVGSGVPPLPSAH